ncbi:MAG: hypothetical protein IT302_13445 [Dehalococcoidia bacterium]|nr:hypothetical protein [Dehalococcoidia bacterium]
MPSSPDSPLPYMLACHHWATLELIAFCEAQPAAVLEAVRPGVYGAIPATLAHLVASERNFLLALLEHEPEDVPPADEAMTLARTAEVVRALAARWQTYAANPEPIDAYRFHPRGAVRIAPILAQTMNHGSEHRAEVATILGASGIQPPTLHPWAYEFMLQARSGGPPAPPPAP